MTHETLVLDTPRDVAADDQYSASELDQYSQKVEELSPDQLGADSKIYGDEFGYYRLKDGSEISIGLIHDDEIKSKLRELLSERMSDESIRTRSFGGSRDGFVNFFMKYAQKNYNIVARVMGAGPKHPGVEAGSIVGCGELIMLNEKETFADVAFEVADVPPFDFASRKELDEAGKFITINTGLGTILVAETFKLAILKGVKRIKTEVLGTNGPMNALFIKICNGEIEGIGPFEYSTTQSSNVINYTIDLESISSERNTNEHNRLGEEILKIAA